MITIDLADKLPSVHALWRSFRRTVVSVKFIGGRQCSKYSRISTTTATRQSVWTPEATKRTCHTQYSSAVDNRRMINSYRATWVRFPSLNPTKSTLTTQPNPSKQNRYSATLSNSFMSVISRSHERRPTQSKFNFVTYRIDNIVIFCINKVDEIKEITLKDFFQYRVSVHGLYLCIFACLSLTWRL